MRSVNYKGKCIKKKLKKSRDISKFYDNIQLAFAERMDSDPDIKEITVNFYLQDFCEGEFTTDIVCVKADGSYMVRECLFRKKLLLPRTCRLLDASHLYWLKRGVEDWGLVIEQEVFANAE